jgi:hypothetical protein
MSQLFKLVINCETGETAEVEFTDAEYADYLRREEAAKLDAETL